MSQNTLPVNDTGRMPPKLIRELLLLKFERLPEKDKKSFANGPVFLGVSGACVGLFANTLYRQVLNVTQGLITSSLPMAVLPFLTTVALYNGAVSQPLLAGELNCPTCALIRGGLVSALAGGFYPVLLALPVSAGLATRYNTAPMPERGNVLRFWINITQPILNRMGIVFLMQAIFGLYMGSKHYGIYIKMLELPTSNSEELND
ncbi:hypothetical protein MATL_G00040030 [Megalops atlanticus]|uniref:Transmembrane protein 126A n=1 Tax=Megalops atlanticus TaxID=7932 RepID=A0A9D3QD07_MEGAT|nr:hypothetical protein MATL_G00040030 [Megalops atlanticus]